MPRMTERRTATAVRFAKNVNEKIDERALHENLLRTDGEPNRSELIRLAVDYYLEKAPAGWRPSGPSDAIGALRGVLDPPAPQSMTAEQVADSLFVEPESAVAS